MSLKPHRTSFIPRINATLAPRGSNASSDYESSTGLRRAFRPLLVSPFLLRTSDYDCLSLPRQGLPGEDLREVVPTSELDVARGLRTRRMQW